MATSMSSNKLVWLGVLLLGGLVAIAVINSSNEKSKKNEKSTTTKPAQEQQAAAPKKLSADGDTVTETLREVQARYEKSLTENESLQRQNEEFNARLLKLENSPGSPVRSTKPDPMVEELKMKFDSISGDVKQLSSNIIKDKENHTANLNGYEVTSTDLGWGESTGGTSSKSKKGVEIPSHVLPGYVSVKPMTRTQLLSADPKLAEKFLRDKLGNAAHGQSGLSSLQLSNDGDLQKSIVKGGKSEPDITPYYTIPARGTIFKSVAMTALIGAVPLGGKISDPFPAKFIVGEENLATNGLRVPGLKGIIFEGVARGNWNLSCVAVTLTAATYTFQDGRIQHMVYDQQQGGSGSKTGKASSPFAENESSRGIGYITNPQGVPCIPGKRVTDAHKQLFTMGVLGAATSYFEAKAAAETTTTDNPLGGGSTSVTGDREAFVNNETYSNTVGTVMDFYSQRMRDTFDVIYSDPGQNVSLNITQDLYIDYHSDARKLAYNAGGSRVNTLD
jgi:integrating conjugative element protein (TIGR03752 family)